ncbi:hypothetical protein GEMMAAP_11315 [Gemmatimonas phototrophica]|uniref:Uncharacterized protein n=2 Tax=Gemmatimonas phototrophica TaxID=1379270 RepID=A0A143BJJ1_9BACT|nr:hypothetical protein GEMMAAP_11315 [Gemmatimonas phototrophica]
MNTMKIFSKYTSMGIPMSNVSRTALWSAAGVFLTAATAVAQNAPPVASAAQVPVRDVTPVIARATQPLTSANMVRTLSDGSVFVNDVQRRQLLKFDASLKNVMVVADTAPGALMPYGQRPIGLLPYIGDSTIVVDASTLSLVVIDRNGKSVRVMASPRPNDINTLTGANLGSHAFDAKGRLYYRQGGGAGGPGGGGAMGMMFGGGNDRGGRGDRGGQGGNNNRQPNTQNQANRGGDVGGAAAGAPGGQPFGGPGGRGFNPASQPDSVPIVRVDFDTRKADTVAFVKVPKNESSMTRGEDGSTRLTVKINPLPQADDWALLSDGTVAIMRVLDYHVDYYRPDGSHVASDKLPFDWKRISDEEKTKLVDSLATMAKIASERMGQNAGGGGGFRMSFEPIGAEKLPDYYPPVRQGSSIADQKGNLWVVPTTSNLSAQLAQSFMGGRGGMGGPPPGVGAPGGTPRTAPGAPRDSTRQAPPAAAMAMMAAMSNQPPLVYDVISPDGKLLERVKLPAGRQVVGFGPDGLIFLSAREGRQMFLETVKLK